VTDDVARVIGTQRLLHIDIEHPPNDEPDATLYTNGDARDSGAM
jgi:hypothetical protein